MKRKRVKRPLQVSLLDRLSEDVKQALRKAVAKDGEPRKEKEN